MDRSNPSAAESASDVSAALVPRTAELAAEIYQLIVREIPALRGDKRVLTLLEATFAEVAPLALMSGSLELLRAWVAETLGPLADDDDHNARLRDTLRVLPAGKRQLQGHRGASGPAQEHGPVPGAQGRGEPAASGGSGSPARAVGAGRTGSNLSRFLHNADYCVRHCAPSQSCEPAVGVPYIRHSGSG